MLKKTIFTDFFTTISFKQFLDSFFLLPKIFIKKWKSIELVEKQFLECLNLKNSKIISFYNARSAIYHCLKLLKIGKNDEVIVSAYNCVSVVNAVIKSWAKIVYADIEKSTLNINLQKLEQKITENTKVIIFQHTFGKWLNIQKFLEKQKKRNIAIIEDSAHCLWGEIWWKKIWWIWDFSIFSIWRDKVISSVNGGFLVINNEKYFSQIENIKSKLVYPSLILVIQNLLYNILWYLSYKCYDFFGFWKIIIYLSRKLKLIPEIISEEEKNCDFWELNYRLPNSFAYLIIWELKKIDEYNKKRIKIAKIYDKNIKNKFIQNVFKKDIENSEKNIYFRYPIVLKDEKIKKIFYDYMRKRNVILWKSRSGQNIVPIWINMEKTKYKKWDCKTSEEISSKILTLPNHKLLTNKDLKKIIKLINFFECIN